MELAKGHDLAFGSTWSASKGWDAALPRVCSWVQLRDKRMNELLWVFNAHFDHQGEEARRKKN